ncbi:MAG: hypothetical protein ABWW69_01365 [Pyrodictiaceae archaeon]
MGEPSGGRKFVIVPFSPLPEAFLRAVFAPYSSMIEGELEIIVASDLRSKEELRRALSRADVVIGGYTLRTSIDRETCSMMEHVRLIQQPSTGFDHIDIDACAERGIPVANIGGANAVSVAEYTIMVALALLRRLIMAHERTSNGEWPQWELMEMGTYEIYGKT